MKRPIKIQHPTPKAEKPYAILPTGLYCNAALQKAKPGQEVIFQTEWRRDKRRIVQLCRFRINSPEFTFMLRSIYGEGMTIARLMERWEAWAIVEGIGKSGFSREEAIVMEIAEIADVAKIIK